MADIIIVKSKGHEALYVNGKLIEQGTKIDDDMIVFCVPVVNMNPRELEETDSCLENGKTYLFPEHLPIEAPSYTCDCISPGCPCQGNCNNIAVREIEYPDKHQQLFRLCENCLHEFFCGFPELEEEYGYERED